MSTIAEMLRKLDNVDLVKLTEDAMESYPDVAVDLNRQQMLEGIKSNNEPIGRYRPFTIFERSRAGRQTSYVDLYLTGEFQSKMYLVLNQDAFYVSSTDSKKEKLVGQYGENIFGLSKSNKLQAWQDYSPIVVRLIKEITGAK